MMYEILLDGKTLYYSGDEECIVMDPEISLRMNEAGSAKMSIPTINPLYNLVKIGNSMLTVKKNNREVFYGEVRAYDRNFDLSRKITAIGALSFLNKSIQPSHNYGNVTHRQFLTAILAIHNEQMFDDDTRKIYIGYTTVENSSNLVDKITDGETTLEAIRNNLIDVHGGVLRLRHVNNNLYLDYITLSEYGNQCNQSITLGDNLMDYAENFSAENVVTVIEPYGSRIEDNDSEFEKRVDITSVNNGKNYLLGSSTAIANYKYNRARVVFDGIDSPATLKTMAQTYLRETQFEKAVFNLTAADLAAVDTSFNAIYFGDRIPVKVPIVGLDATYPIVEMVMKPHNPEDERITLSANIRTKKVTMTGRMNDASREAVAIAEREALKMKQVIAGEIANIMATFSGQYGGYKLSEFDSNGLWLRDLYMDAPDKDDATNIMEFSMRGIRFSTAGYKAPTDSAWKLAITIDGKIASQEIFSNIIFANLLKAGIIQDVAGNTSWNLETGSFLSKALHLVTRYLEITTDGRIIAKNPNDLAESFEIYESRLNGYRNGNMIGYIDLSAQTGSGNNISEDLVIGANGKLRLEFTSEIDFVDVSNPSQPLLVGMIDGNGYHGQLDDSYFPAPTVIYVNEGDDYDGEE